MIIRYGLCVKTGIVGNNSNIIPGGATLLNVKCLVIQAIASPT